MKRAADSVLDSVEQNFRHFVTLMCSEKGLYTETEPVDCTVTCSCETGKIVMFSKLNSTDLDPS